MSACTVAAIVVFGSQKSEIKYLKEKEESIISVVVAAVNSPVDCSLHFMNIQVMSVSVSVSDLFQIIVFIARHLAAEVPLTDKCVFSKVIKAMTAHAACCIFSFDAQLNFDLAAPVSLNVLFPLLQLMHILWIQVLKLQLELLRLFVHYCVSLFSHISQHQHSQHRFISRTSYCLLHSYLLLCNSSVSQRSQTF